MTVKSTDGNKARACVCTRSCSSPALEPELLKILEVPSCRSATPKKDASNWKDPNLQSSMPHSHPLAQEGEAVGQSPVGNLERLTCLELSPGLPCCHFAAFVIHFRYHKMSGISLQKNSLQRDGVAGMFSGMRAPVCSSRLGTHPSRLVDKRAGRFTATD